MEASEGHHLPGQWKTMYFPFFFLKKKEGEDRCYIPERFLGRRGKRKGQE